jgi:hypothetical protein
MARLKLALSSFNILFMYVSLKKAYYICIPFRYDGKPMDQLRMSASPEDDGGHIPKMKQY